MIKFTALMSPKEIIENISNIFFPLSDMCKKDFLEVSKIVSFEKTSLIVKEGQIAQNMYFIIKGSARAFYMKDGKDVTDWFAFENDFITAINSYFMNMPSPHFIAVNPETVLLQLSKESISKLSAKHLDFERMGNTIVTKTMLQLQQRIVSLQFETAQQKYENLLAVYPDITLKTQLTHIASYLGISLETLSRLRKQKKSNLI